MWAVEWPGGECRPRSRRQAYKLQSERYWFSENTGHVFAPCATLSA